MFSMFHMTYINVLFYNIADANKDRVLTNDKEKDKTDGYESSITIVVYCVLGATTLVLAVINCNLIICLRRSTTNRM